MPSHSMWFTQEPLTHETIKVYESRRLLLLLSMTDLNSKSYMPVLYISYCWGFPPKTIGRRPES